MISNVKGEFTSLTGTIAYDPDNLEESRVEAVIDANTINTRDEQRDAHLRSADFFDTAKYPTLTFRSKEFTSSGGRLSVRGDLTIRGVTREVLLAVDGPTPEVKDPWGNYRFGATATTKVSRKDWGLVWNSVLETGGVMVGDEVTITLDLEAMRQAEDTTMVSHPVAS
jgi:polyisoprenoid-binding protein YceI